MTADRRQAFSVPTDLDEDRVVKATFFDRVATRATGNRVANGATQEDIVVVAALKVVLVPRFGINS